MSTFLSDHVAFENPPLNPTSPFGVRNEMGNLEGTYMNLPRGFMQPFTDSLDFAFVKYQNGGNEYA